MCYGDEDNDIIAHIKWKQDTHFPEKIVIKNGYITGESEYFSLEGILLPKSSNNKFQFNINLTDKQNLAQFQINNYQETQDLFMIEVGHKRYYFHLKLAKN